MEHEDDPDIDEPYVPPAENVLGGISENKPAPEEPTLADTAEGQRLVWLIVFMSKHYVYTVAYILHNETIFCPLCHLCKYCLVCKWEIFLCYRWR